MERKNMWEGYSEAELKELEAVNARYRECLDVAKTERECVKLTRRLAEEQGYQNLKTFIENGTSLKAGDKVYAECMGKTIVLFQIGKEPMEKGMNILGAHVDSPRLDVKQNPLYEDSQLAYLDTHYYGGIPVGNTSIGSAWCICKERRNSTGSFNWGKERRSCIRYF